MFLESASVKGLLIHCTPVNGLGALFFSSSNYSKDEWRYPKHRSLSLQCVFTLLKDSVFLKAVTVKQSNAQIMLSITWPDRKAANVFLQEYLDDDTRCWWASPDCWEHWFFFILKSSYLGEFRPPKVFRLLILWESALFVATIPLRVVTAELSLLLQQCKTHDT